MEPSPGTAANTLLPSTDKPVVSPASCGRPASDDTSVPQKEPSPGGACDRATPDSQSATKTGAKGSSGRRGGGIAIHATVEVDENGNEADITAMEEDVIRSRNVYVAELPLTFTEDHFVALMQQFGDVATHRLFNNTRRVRHAGRAYGFCLYRRAQDAEKAVEGLNGLSIEGRTIEVRCATNGVVKAPPQRGHQPDTRSRAQGDRRTATPRTDVRRRASDSSRNSLAAQSDQPPATLELPDSRRSSCFSDYPTGETVTPPGTTVSGFAHANVSGGPFPLQHYHDPQHQQQQAPPMSQQLVAVRMPSAPGGFILVPSGAPPSTTRTSASQPAQPTQQPYAMAGTTYTQPVLQAPPPLPSQHQQRQGSSTGLQRPPSYYTADVIPGGHQPWPQLTYQQQMSLQQQPVARPPHFF